MTKWARLTDVLIFTGPSGSGKSSLIHRLRHEFPDLFRFCVSHTTRTPRQGERNGEDYHFVTHQQFCQLVDSKGMLEHTHLFGRNLEPTSSGVDGCSSTGKSTATGTLYGTSKRALHCALEMGNVVLMDTDIQGAMSVKRFCEADGTMKFDPPNSLANRADKYRIAEGCSVNRSVYQLRGVVLRCRVVFVRPPNMSALHTRLLARRSETAASITQRLADSETCLSFYDSEPHLFDLCLVNDDLEQCYAALRRYVDQFVIKLDIAAHANDG